jgi:membrane protease YdiL (CAAX protease family)
MTTWSLVILSQAAEPSAGDSSVTSTQVALPPFDKINGGLAIACAVVAGLWWLIRSRQNPLGAAPLRPNRLREDSLALAVLVYLTGLLIIAGAVRLIAGTTENVVGSLVVGNGAQIAGLAACLAIAAGRFDGGLRPFWFGTGTTRKRLAAAVTVMLVIIATGLCPIVLQFTIELVVRLAPDYKFAAHPTIKALSSEAQPIGVAIALWIGAVVIAPVAEEVFFRGLLQTFLVRVLGRRWPAIVVAAVLFSLAHLSSPHHIPALVVLAVMLGYAYERTGSLVSPILIHAAFNLKTLVWNALGGYSG